MPKTTKQPTEKPLSKNIKYLFDEVQMNELPVLELVRNIYLLGEKMVLPFINNSRHVLNTKKNTKFENGELFINKGSIMEEEVLLPWTKEDENKIKKGLLSPQKNIHFKIKKVKKEKWIKVPSKEEILQLLIKLHGENHTNARDKMLAAIEEEFHFIGKTEAVKTFIKRCEFCQENKTPSSKVQVRTPRAVTIPNGPFSLYFLDCFDLPNVRGFKHCICFIDAFTKRTIVFPSKTKDGEVIKKKLEHVVEELTLAGVKVKDNLKIRLDNGSEFSNSTVKGYCEEMGIELAFGIADVPTSQSVVEKVNQTLKKSIKNSIKLGKKDWLKSLPNCVETYNSTIHSTTGYSPNQLHEEFLLKEASSNQERKLRIIKLKLLKQKVTDRIIKRGNQNNYSYLRGTQGTNPFQVGTTVRVRRPSTIRRSEAIQEGLWAKKATIIKSNNNNTFLCKWSETGGWKKSQKPNTTSTVHITHIKLYHFGKDSTLSLHESDSDKETESEEQNSEIEEDEETTEEEDDETMEEGDMNDMEEDSEGEMNDLLCSNHDATTEDFSLDDEETKTSDDCLLLESNESDLEVKTTTNEKEKKIDDEVKSYLAASSDEEIVTPIRKRRKSRKRSYGMEVNREEPTLKKNRE